MKNNEFLQAKDTYLERLTMFVPIVDKVHGKHHPEFHDVRRVFETMKDKIEKEDFILDNEFKELKIITNNYEVPNDVCESYEAVYHMLENLNNVYNNQKE